MKNPENAPKTPMVTMSAVLRTMLCLMLLCLAGQSHAFNCTGNAVGDVNITGQFERNYDPALPRGTVLWRGRTSMNFGCVNDPGDAQSQIIFVMDNLRQSLGDELRIRTESESYTHSFARVRCESNTGCSVALADPIPACGNRCLPRGPINQEITWILEKNTAPHTGQTAPRIPDNLLMAVIRRNYGSSSAPGVFTRMYLRGLDQLPTQPPCMTTMDAVPSVDFGGFTVGSARVGSVIRQMPFAITLRKNCDSLYAVNGSFVASGNTRQIDSLLVPNDNPSVGLALHDLDADQARSFGQSFALVDARNPDRIVTRRFRADLSLRQSPVRLGSFSATVVLEFNYR